MRRIIFQLTSKTLSIWISIKIVWTNPFNNSTEKVSGEPQLFPLLTSQQRAHGIMISSNCVHLCVYICIHHICVYLHYICVLYLYTSVDIVVSLIVHLPLILHFSYLCSHLMLRLLLFWQGLIIVIKLYMVINQASLASLQMARMQLLDS